jgi:hypothetical protein
MQRPKEDTKLTILRFQNKELEATEERKRKAKQLEMQRKESARSGRVPRAPNYPTYTPPAQPSTTTYDSYEAEKNKTFNKYVALDVAHTVDR